MELQGDKLTKKPTLHTESPDCLLCLSSLCKTGRVISPEGIERSPKTETETDRETGKDQEMQIFFVFFNHYSVLTQPEQELCDSLSVHLLCIPPNPFS